jgi:anti-anti-sigma regulatory factor
MLRITVVASPAAPIVLRLEGHVDAEGGALVERECAAFLSGGGAVALDMTAVRFVSHAGCAALGRLARVGVEIRCRAGVVASVLQSDGIRVVEVSSGE